LGAAAAVALEVLEELADQLGVEFADIYPGWLFAELIGREAEQQPHRVAVGGDRVRADGAFADQPVGEERL
jgi:acyl-coenzyme A thioesterase PaaI-like protein